MRNSDASAIMNGNGLGSSESSLPAQMLDTQKSLKVNIFLKQFRNEQQVLSAVRAGAADQLGAERLLHLLRLLPDDGELEMLCSVEELGRLPPAERFLVKLLAIPRCATLLLWFRNQIKPEKLFPTFLIRMLFFFVLFSPTNDPTFPTFLPPDSSRLRIECMLLKEEYESNFAHLRPSLDTLIQAGKGAS